MTVEITASTSVKPIRRQVAKFRSGGWQRQAQLADGLANAMDHRQAPKTPLAAATRRYEPRNRLTRDEILMDRKTHCTLILPVTPSTTTVLCSPPAESITVPPLFGNPQPLKMT